LLLFCYLDVVTFQKILYDFIGNIHYSSAIYSYWHAEQKSKNRRYSGEFQIFEWLKILFAVFR